MKIFCVFPVGCVGQVACAALAAMAHATIGTMLGLPGVILPQLTDPTSHDLFLNTSQVALFGSLIHVGAMAGSLVGGGLSVYLGQRATLLMVMPFCLVLWLGMAFTSTVWVLQLMRALLGVAQGFIATTSGNYLVEITHSSLRGSLIPFLDIWRQFGILLVYAVGSLHLTWHEVMLVCGCVSTVPIFIALLFLPNSPRWLVTRSREQEAYKALVFLRGPHYNSKIELQSIVDHFQEEDTNKKSVMEQLKQMREPNNLYRLTFISIITVFLQFTGNIPIVTYSVPIFQAANSSMNSYGCLVSIACLRVMGIMIYMIVAERLGRRLVVITSSLICTVALLLLGVYFLLQNSGADVSAITWLPLFSLLVYMPFVVILESIISILRSEIFSNSIRPMAVSVASVVFFLSMFMSTQLFPIMTETITEQGVFWTYALSCLLMALTTAVLLPETSGLTLEELDHVFKYGKKVVLPIPCVHKKVRISE
ncbi:Facilitated trehalose transporter Tret1 [Portunus trituberculatus]|uniref:Facilitated trehalose transporter Tret1 n=1 Tax=Portunus trituberculatus TaxID=210409 RepID=A0A5B7CKH8_PORTR|nr:Facilitated trehalose transporter Tret1 [Portunus trituberculatus]